MIDETTESINIINSCSGIYLNKNATRFALVEFLAQCDFCNETTGFIECEDAHFASFHIKVLSPSRL